MVDDNLGFAKDRTISRLTEMQVGRWLGQHACLCVGFGWQGHSRVACRLFWHPCKDVAACVTCRHHLQSEEYLRAHAKAHAPELLLAMNENKAAAAAAGGSRR